MIKGIGTDLVEISRIEKAVMRSKRIITKLFAEEEICYCQQKKSLYESYAARFAAKEAILKSLGLGLGALPWTDMVILTESTGQPYIELRGKAQTIAQDLGIKSFSLSLSHTKDLALAFVIAE